MKRKSIKAILLIAAVLVMMVVFAACEKDKDDNGSGVQPGNEVNQQSGDGANLPEIPPGAVRERQDEGSQTFQIDPNDPNSDSFSHSFSVDESVGNHSFRSCLKITSTN